MITSDINSDLDLPETKNIQGNELPIKEVLTNSEEAMKHHIWGRNASEFDNNWNQLLYFENKAIELDSAFALAYMHILYGNLALNNTIGMKQTFDKLMVLKDKLPETMKFNFLYSYYSMYKNDLDKAKSVVEMWIELYPEDISGHLIMMNIHLLAGRTDERIEELKTIIKLSPSQYSYKLQLAGIYTTIGEYKKALSLYKEYQKRFPDRVETYRNLGDFYSQKGDFDEASKAYDKIFLIEPNNVDAYIKQSNIYRAIGDFEKSVKYFTEALTVCKKPQDEVKVYDCIMSYYQMRGQITSLLDILNKKYETMYKYEIPLSIFVTRIVEMRNFVLGGDTSVALKLLRDFNAEILYPYNRITDFGYLSIYEYLKDSVMMKEYILRAEETIDTMHLQVFRAYVFDAKGCIAEMQGNYEKALDIYECSFEAYPTRISIYVDIGRCYRHIKEYKKSIESIKKRLFIQPNNPRSNYEIGMTYLTKGDKTKALEHFKIAYEVLIDADPTFELYKDVLQEYEELQVVEFSE
jgi:tetratricopeptide (TPR) repeat protein